MARGASESRVVAALATDGFAVEPDYLDGDAVRRLRERLQWLAQLGQLAPAAVGRGDARAQRQGIRGDRIRWLGDAPEDASEVALFGLVESLRLAANRELALGLFEFEGHYATYPAGARYAPHRDRFRDDDSRVLSLVLYLNEKWHDGDGGELRLHVAAGAWRDVVPAGGTLVAFLSEQFEHEVLPATRERMAIAGWFKRRG